jgi:hypothetical protein
VPTLDLRIDVSGPAGLGQPASTAATVRLPEPTNAETPTVVCFAFPGGGYCRRYYTFDMPDSTGGGQAGFHVDRGWIFVAVDHLGFGDSTVPDGDVLDYETIARGNRATVESIMAMLEAGTLLDGYPAVSWATKLGIGQSMGGCFTIVLQGQFATFDGIASLGFSGIHTHVPSRPGSPPSTWPWYLRGADVTTTPPLNAASLAAGTSAPDAGTQPDAAPQAVEHPFTWAFHYDDEPAAVVAADMNAGLDGGPLPEWRSPTTPSCGLYMVAPGTVATEAASITAPVLLAMGERDVVRDPWMEPFAFRSSTDITLFVCPRMAHMHNFAGTRHRFWDRIHTWGESVASQARGAT